jgi:glycosyltransferase involved in cell wall biosynthesis
MRKLFAFKVPIGVIDIGLTESWKIRERILDFVVPRVDAIFVLGSNQIEYIKSRWRTSAMVEFFHQHVDTKFYCPMPEALGGPILAVGEDRGRDFETLLEAARGIDSDVVLKTRRVAPDALRHPNVRVISSFMSGTEYRKLFAECRFVVVPLASSVHASGVGTVLEALAMGKALIVSDSPGIRDYIIPGETALTVPCSDVEALRNAMQRLLLEPHTCARLGLNGRRFVEQHCSHAVHARKLSDSIRRVRARQHASSAN